ncbi:MAG: HPr kinase/phosphorylase [Qipengyuania sp.]
MSGHLLANVTCVAVGGRAIMIEGPPGSGKSSLALALLDRGAALVGDDGIELEQSEGLLMAAPPPTIAGKLEVRGVGIVERPSQHAPVALILSLDAQAPRTPELAIREVLGNAIPALAFRPGDANQAIRAELALEQFGLEVPG